MVFLFHSMVPPGRFEAACVSGAPPRPNRVLQGQQKQNQAQEKSLDKAMANTSAVTLGTTLVLLYHMYTGAHMCALYEVAKHTLVDQVRHFFFVGGLCCWLIVLANTSVVFISYSSINFVSYCNHPK